MTRPEIIITIRGGNVANVHVNKAMIGQLLPNVRIIDYDILESDPEYAEKHEKEIMDAELDRDSSEYLNIY